MKASVVFLGAAIVAAGAAGAWAKDAVVADQPELMSPGDVDACAAYGTGFTRLPGTETCIRVGGQVRFDKQIYGTSHASSRSRATFSVETRSDPW